MFRRRRLQPDALHRQGARRGDGPRELRRALRRLLPRPLPDPDWSSDPEAVPYAKLGNPQSLNLYAYVQNNPVNAIDLDGHFIEIRESDGEDDLKQKSPSECPGLAQCKQGDASDVPSQGRATPAGAAQNQQQTNFGPLQCMNANCTTATQTVTVTASNPDELNPFAQGVFTQLNQMNIMNNTLKIYGASVLIGVTGGAACYYLCEEAGALALGEIIPGPGASRAARLVTQGGKKALQRGIRSLSRKSAEHEAKIQAGKAAGGFTSSMEAEVANWKSIVQAMENILRNMP